MSAEKQRLMALTAKAENALAAKPPFTPYEMPARLHELKPGFLQDLFDLGYCFGLENWAADGKAKRVLKLGQDRSIHLAVSQDRERPFMVVGDVRGQHHYLLIRSGLVVWEARLTPGEVRQAAAETLSRMKARGLVAESGLPICLMEHPEARLEVADYFPTGAESYEIDPMADPQALQNRFDHPRLLTTVRQQGCLRLCRTGFAEIADKLPEFRLSPKPDPDMVRQEQGMIVTAHSSKNFS